VRVVFGHRADIARVGSPRASGGWMPGAPEGQLP